MHQLWLIPFLPLAGFLVNGLFGKRLSKSVVSMVAIGSVALSFLWVVKTLMAIAPLETPTAGYTLVSADLDWRIGSGQGADLSFFVRATNLLDEVALRHSSFIKDIAPLPGVNYSVGLRALF